MWDSVIHQALILIFALATPPALLLMHSLVSKLAAKLHLANVAQYSDQIDTLVAQAVNGAEKVAMAAVATSKTVQTGEEKLNGAIAWVNSELVRLKLDPVDPTKLATRIEAELISRMPAPTASASAVPTAPITLTETVKV